jgi:hypothetical protein
LFEHRALGIPVITTAFGEMLEHCGQTVVFIADSFEGLFERVEAALEYQGSILNRLQFLAANSWRERFNFIDFPL